MMALGPKMCNVFKKSAWHGIFFARNEQDGDVRARETIVTYSRYGSNIVALILTGLVIYIAGYGVFDEVWVRAGTVGLSIIVSILYFSSENLDVPRDDVGWPAIVWNGFLLAILAVVFYYWITLMLEQQELFVDFQLYHYWIGIVGFLLTFLLTWRHFGSPLLIVCLIAFAYVFLGKFLPQPLTVPDLGWYRVSENLWYSTDGVFGRPVAVVGQIVLIFILFGAILESSGAGATLLKFAFAVTGRLRGGPAHAAIVGSAMFGTMNGAAVANVVSTGVFTIPMIKKAGFEPKFAGAVEAAASTGGQIMPPVMGAVAFLMADITGIPYIDIIVAASIPAVLYYANLFFVVVLEARKQGIQPVPVEERARLTARDWLRSISFFVPLGIIVWTLLDGRTAQAAGFFGMIAAFVLSLLLYPEFRSIRKIIQAFIRGGRTCAVIMIVVAAIGFIVGAINMTGLGIKFAAMIESLSGTSLFLSLLLVMVGCLALGMGVPTGAAYLIIVLVIGPALSKLGLSLLLIHLFVIYFGVLSAITPPVAIAAFAAAPIAGSRPIETGFTAVKLAIAGFLIPFLFIYHPSIVLIDKAFSISGLVWGLAAFAFSTAGIATALQGYSIHRIPNWQRAIRLVAGACVLIPDLRIAIVSAAAILAVFVVEIFNGGKRVQAIAQD